MDRLLDQPHFATASFLMAVSLWVIFMGVVHWRTSKKTAAEAANAEDWRGDGDHYVGC